MANRTKPASEKRGRKTKKDFQTDRTRVLCELYRHYANDSKVQLEYQDIDNLIGTDRRTTKRVCQDVVSFCSLVDLYERGIQAGDTTFFRTNLEKNVDAKCRIGRKLAELLRPHHVSAIALGPGTTVAMCAAMLAQNLTVDERPEVVVTNSLGCYEVLQAIEGTELIVTGGRYKLPIHALVGVDAVNSFSNAHCEASVMGASAINQDSELLVKYPDEPEVLKQMLRSTTERVFVVATLEKFVSRDTFPVVKISQLLHEEHSNLEIVIITASSKDLRDSETEHRAKEVIAALERIGNKVKVVWADE